MTIKSSFFGSAAISGSDASKFVNQFKFGRPKKAAREGLARGVLLLNEFKLNGYASLKDITGVDGK